MSVKLRKRTHKDGSTTLFLDIYVKGKRTYDFLTELKLKKATTPTDREINREKLKIAEQVLAKRILEVAENEHDIFKASVLPATQWMNNYVTTYTKRDKRNMQGAKNRFLNFLDRAGKGHIKMKEIDECLVIQYKDHLQETCVGEGAHSYFARFKKMIKQALRDKMIRFDPCQGVRMPKGKARIKDTLTFEEIQLIANIGSDKDEIKKAFLFCCVTGLRWADITILKWINIDLRNKQLRIRQAKTGEDLRITLNATAINLLGEFNQENQNTCVFTLPSQNYGNKHIQNLVDKAEIRKKITWHCARHTFGTNLLYYGTDVFTASKLLGHTSIKHTQRYIRAADELKMQAVNKLPEIKV